VRRYSALLPHRLVPLPLVTAVAIQSPHCHHSSAPRLKKEVAHTTPLTSHATCVRSAAAVCFHTTTAASMHNSSTRARERLLKHGVDPSTFLPTHHCLLSAQTPRSTEFSLPAIVADVSSPLIGHYTASITPPTSQMGAGIFLLALEKLLPR
jgi:hypothetical protein